MESTTTDEPTAADFAGVQGVQESDIAAATTTEEHEQRRLAGECEECRNGDPHAEVTRLTAELAAAEQRHRDEVRWISEALIDEANEREMCSEYDNVIDRINRDSRITVPLSERENDVTVRFVGTVHFEITRDVVVSLPPNTRLDSDLARDRAEQVVRSLSVRALALSASESTLHVEQKPRGLNDF